MRFRPILAIAAACLFLPLAPVTARAATPKLNGSHPPAGAIVHGAPNRLELRFTAPPVAAASRIVVTEAHDPHNIAGRPHGVTHHPDRLAVPLFVRSPGRLHVTWRAGFAHGATARGRFSFTVAP